MNDLDSFIFPSVPCTTNDQLTLIATAKGYFTAEECQRIIEISQSSEFKDGTIGQDNSRASLRKSNVTCLRPGDDTKWLFEKLGKALMHMNQNSYHYNLKGFYEGVQIARYEDSGEYGWHVDIGPGENSTRKLSMSVQLTDGPEYEGGNLEFTNVSQQSERGIGSLIVFPSFLTHRVTPVTSGTRHSMVAWVHGDAFA